jgi:hypothetical protein
MRETKGQLELRKLKAETELAERQLAEEKAKPRYERCGMCNGHRGSTRVTGGGWSGRMRVRVFDPCRGCGGVGRRRVA